MISSKTSFLVYVEETLNKYHFLTIRHSGESRDHTGMTVRALLGRFLNIRAGKNGRESFL